MNNEDLNIINKTSPNLLDERLAELKRLFPDLFDGNGNLNEKELKDLLSKYTTPQVEKFTFEWGGKSASKKLAFTPSKATLVPDRERSVNFDETQNLIIEGDNLHVLKLLQGSYVNRIKCIYIDPPYNTGKDFIYPDNYRETEKEYWEKNGQVHDGVKLDSNFETNGRLHSSWLSMMQSRLLLARKLLSDDGVIFVSIDDNEVHNLRKLLDEVFGEENFIAQIIRVSNSAKNNSNQISVTHDYVLTYAKYLENVSKDWQVPKNNYKEFESYAKRLQREKNSQEEIEAELKILTKYPRFYDFDHYYYCDEIGVYRTDNPGGVPNGNMETDIIHPITNKPCQKPSRGWRYDETTIKSMLENNLWHFGVDESTIPTPKRYLKDYLYQNPTAIAFFDSQIDTKDFIKEGIPFDNPKPKDFIKHLIRMNTSNEDIVLDFFAGSGTTAHAVLDLNLEDGNKRKYILVQIPEYTKEDSEAYKLGFKKISDITIKRIKRVSKSISETGKSLDTGFKTFRQFFSHFPENTWRPDATKSNSENEKLFKDYLEKAKRNNLNLFESFEFEPILYEILIKQGFDLNVKIEKIKDFILNNVYLAKDYQKETLICLDKNLEQVTIEDLISKHAKDGFICIENSLDTTNKWKLSKALGKNLEVVS